MSKFTGSGANRWGEINTLAYSGTTFIDKSLHQEAIIVNGNGTDLSNEKALKGRAKRKTITQKLMLIMVDIARNKGAEDRVKAYWNTYHCQSKVISSDGKLYGNYCKNRFCTVCLAIRKADIINRYLPVIKQWKDPRFVTLTVRSIHIQNLVKFFDGLEKAFDLTKNKYKKRNQRGKDLKLIGIKSLECNFNPLKQTYNPHFHFLVPDYETAKILIAEWLQKWTRKFTSPISQHSRRVNDTERDLIEIIKYGSKLFTEPDIKNKSKKKEKADPFIYANALDSIFEAMKGRRLFDRFGFNLPKSSTNKTSKIQSLDNFEEWTFDMRTHDWLNKETGELLTGYVISNELDYLLKLNIDRELN